MELINNLRKVKLTAPGGEYILEIWDTQRDEGYLGYEFTGPNGKVLFTGHDFKPSPLHAIDSDESLRGLLGFLTLKPGDTDAEYFDDYTEEQRAFAQSYDCEYLGLYTLSPEEGHSKETIEFEDVE